MIAIQERQTNLSKAVWSANRNSGSLSAFHHLNLSQSELGAFLRGSGGGKGGGVLAIHQIGLSSNLSESFQGQTPGPYSSTEQKQVWNV
jgi:hypothetical protein